MNFYLHYKNKPYKVHGIAKHSETLQELVVYETLYDNPTAKLWVRPREMFEESISLNGKNQPRFAKVSLQIEKFQQIEENQIELLKPLLQSLFGEWDPKWFHAKIKGKSLFGLFARMGEQVVGFKIGYTIDSHTFYSWLGGVHKDYQRLGIGRDLMQAQHQWCREMGYQKVQTKTQNRFKGQLILNLQMGFDVIGYIESTEGGPKILLQKNL